MDVVEYGDCEVRGKRGRRGRERVKGERWRECYSTHVSSRKEEFIYLLNLFFKLCVLWS
jgi:hypothetical protein